MHGGRLLRTYSTTHHHYDRELLRQRAATSRTSSLVGPVPSTQSKEWDWKYQGQGNSSSLSAPQAGLPDISLLSLTICSTAFLKWENMASPARWVFQTHLLTIISSWSYLDVLPPWPIFNFGETSNWIHDIFSNPSTFSLLHLLPASIISHCLPFQYPLVPCLFFAPI